jgi:hypothetical protein
MTTNKFLQHLISYMMFNVDVQNKLHAEVLFRTKSIAILELYSWKALHKDARSPPTDSRFWTRLAEHSFRTWTRQSTYVYFAIFITSLKKTIKILFFWIFNYQKISIKRLLSQPISFFRISIISFK